MYKKIVPTVFINLLFTVLVWSQDLVSSEFLGSLSQAELTASSGFPAKNGIEVYKILYTTLDTENELDTASGLIAIPDLGMGSFPMMVYQHGTVDGKQDVPSNLNGEYQIVALSAGQGYIVLGPDYLGLGESRGFHPYVHAKTEATAALDLMRSINAFISTTGVSFNDQLFITGYSQGGHAAMALHKEIELYHSEEYTVTASAPMSGPYSISEAMLDILISEDDYTFMSYFPYTLIAYQYVYGNLFTELSDIFNDIYIPIIAQFYEEDYSVFSINEELLAKVFQETGTYQVNKLIRPDVLEEIKNNKNHPLRQVFKENDTYTWIPQAPIQLAYCLGDDRVPAQNSIIADSFFVANGAKNTSILDVSSSADHIQCIQPSVLSAYIFFQQFKNSTHTSESGALSSIQIFPNPAKDIINIDLNDQYNREYSYRLINIQGQTIMNGYSTKSSLELDQMKPGIYIFEIKIGNALFNERLVISN